MAFEQEVHVLGDEHYYRFNPALKKYALGDTGFVTNNAGAHVLQRALEPEKGIAHSIKLKVVIDKDLTGMKIKTVSPNGNSTVNIFKQAEQNANLIELYNFYLDELVQREIMERI